MLQTEQRHIPIDARAVLTRRMSERELMANIIELAGYLGFYCFHPWSSLHSAAGWPDLTLCRPASGERPGRLVVAELKSEYGKLSRAQERWLYALTSVGVECRLWRPSDWFSGEVECVLTAEEVATDAA
jgi:hypothetical protein